MFALTVPHLPLWRGPRRELSSTQFHFRFREHVLQFPERRIDISIWCFRKKLVKQKTLLDRFVFNSGHFDIHYFCGPRCIFSRCWNLDLVQTTEHDRRAKLSRCGNIDIRAFTRSELCRTEAVRRRAVFVWSAVFRCGTVSVVATFSLVRRDQYIYREFPFWEWTRLALHFCHISEFRGHFQLFNRRS